MENFKFAEEMDAVQVKSKFFEFSDLQTIFNTGLENTVNIPLRFCKFILRFIENPYRQ